MHVNAELASFESKFRTICLNKCCLCIPLKNGVIVLLLIQIFAGIPYALCGGLEHMPSASAVATMAILFIDVTLYMYFIVSGNHWFVLATIIGSIASIIFHLTMLHELNFFTPDIPKDVHLKHLLFAASFLSLSTFPYMLFLLSNIYVRAKRENHNNNNNNNNQIIPIPQL